MQQAKYEVADVLHALGASIETQGYNVHQLRTLRAIKACRTAVLGGHIDACTNCGIIKISYNSCRNRHCPKCQGHKRVEWIEKRATELLPVPYFHVVFTLPSELNKLAMHAPKVVYDALFAAAWQTLEAFGAKQSVQMGMISILHTWGQNLSLHPHLHCIVPGAGVNKNACPPNRQGALQGIRKDGKFLFSVKAMSKVFRAKYVSMLRSSGVSDKNLYDALFKKEWVVFAKRPFGNTQSVIEYLGRYTHKIAISNARIKEVTATHVSFMHKVYKDGGNQKLVTLTNEEFVRRFVQHILPKRFVRIRHFGFLSTYWKRSKLQALQLQLKVVQKEYSVQTKLHCCPHCKTPTMVMIDSFDRRGPPEEYITGQKTNTA